MARKAPVTVLLPRGKAVTRVPASSLEAARAMVAAHLVGRRQTLRCLRRTDSEEVYTIPNGRHAAIEIGVAG